MTVNESLLETLFLIAALLWVTAIALFGPRYVATLWRVRNPRRAPFVLSLATLGFLNLVETSFYLYVLLWSSPQSWSSVLAVYTIPISFIFQAMSWMLVASWAQKIVPDEAYAHTIGGG